MSSEEHQLDNQDEYATVLDDDKDSDDRFYEEHDLFIEDNYEGFAFVQDVIAT